MKSGIPARTRRSLICLASLLLLAPVTWGCGPQIYQSGFLASWSRDGSRLALVPDVMNEDRDAASRLSGILIYNSATGESKRIISVGTELVCLQAQWSPFSNDLLFVTVNREEEDQESRPGKAGGYIVWCVGPDGNGLRQIASGTFISDQGNGMTILRPNAVAWGDRADTYLLQERIGDRVTAVLFDPHTGDARQFLPDAADGYSLEPSPNRHKIAALLYDQSTGLARLFVSDFGYRNWRLLDIVTYDADQLQGLAPMIYWSPDSTQFVVAESAPGENEGVKDRGCLRLYEIARSGSRRIAKDFMRSTVQWSRDGRSLLYSAAGAEDESELVVYRVDLESGRKTALTGKGRNHLMAWNWQSGRVFFYRTSGKDETSLNELFSCAGDGSDVRAEGFAFGGETPSWCASSGGRSLVIYLEPLAPTLLDSTAIARLVRLQF